MEGATKSLQIIGTPVSVSETDDLSDVVLRVGNSGVTLTAEQFDTLCATKYYIRHKTIEDVLVAD